ncbi:DUF4124 domain-containing protein [Rhodoferax sp. AJA081-3]|uniref:DUF4124 domain-containing protein n=1 Tax=Rhodoferax sp. AJA081-3 TaxID=2752316 RepID=UPI001ADFE68D|nr:DUF4124 domain-containing protein [Rhodoferax sp. AJA081-3]QTN28717.1 DUF4124 domain-containing protein [Rhodoferax sp. AJA081-3]
MKLIQTLLVVALSGLSFAASAQWQWLDKDGRKVYSDRAPPSDIQDKNIIKRPGNYKAPVVAPAADAAVEGDAAAASAPVAGQAAALPASGAKPAGGLDKELEAKKKQAKEAEAAKRKADEERIAKAQIENCARAKQAKTTFESGVRIGRTNAAGEKEFMDDAARAAELKRIQGIIDRDCK